MKRGILIMLCLTSLLLMSASFAITGFHIDRWTIDGGAGESRGTGYVLYGSIGQPEAGEAQGVGYQLQGGFWAGIHLPRWAFFLPTIFR